ncbi:hypothetical protein FRB90_002068 [Tulasnella sp. 427]|nr:hypothetical protein FRB90_002068 [Tulasnella sp. 427]
MVEIFDQAFASGILFLSPLSGNPPAYLARSAALRVGPHTTFASFTLSFPTRQDISTIHVSIPQRLLEQVPLPRHQVWVDGQLFVHAVPGAAVEYELIVNRLEFDIRHFTIDLTGILRVRLKALNHAPTRFGNGMEGDAYILQHVEDARVQYWTLGPPWVPQVLPFFRATPGLWRWIRLPGTWAYSVEDFAELVVGDVPDELFAGLWALPNQMDVPLMGPAGRFGFVISANPEVDLPPTLAHVPPRLNHLPPPNPPENLLLGQLQVGAQQQEAAAIHAHVPAAGPCQPAAHPAPAADEDEEEGQAASGDRSRRRTAAPAFEVSR